MRFLRVEINNRKQFVKFENVHGITIKTLVTKAVQSFALENVKGSKVKIFDSLDTIIDTDEILQHVLQTCSPDLSVKIVFEKPESKNNDIISSDDIEMFIDQNGGKDLIAAHKKNGSLDETKRRKLVNIVVQFLVDKYGVFPNKHQKISVATATVNLFHCFKLANSEQGGIEMFYNPSNGLGWIVSKLKTIRSNMGKSAPNNENNVDENDNNHDDGLTSYDPREDVDFLQTIVVNEANMPIIHAKLIKTLEYRRKLFEDKNLNLLERFPYFFTHPQLVSYDFDYLYKAKKDIFMKNWLLIKDKIENVLQLHCADKDFASLYDQDVEQMLMLLKLLPLRLGGRSNIPNRANFSKAVEKLVVFAKHGIAPMSSMLEENRQPYIIAFGATPKMISKYFIAVEQNLVEVPEDFSFIDTFDLLFKFHHVLNFSFDDNLKTMMNFIQHFYYKIVSPQIKMSPHQMRVYNDLTR